MKKILTSNGKILTENGKILTANVESGGGLIEVTELPEVGKANTVYKLIHKNVGTEVPTTGTIENYYLNVSLSINEVVDILSQLTYQSGTDANTNVVFQTDNHNIICYQVDGAYAIKADNAYVFASNLTLAERLQCSSIGWNVAYITEDWTPKTPVAVNETTLTEEDLGMPIGAENDKVINLFSITPFEEEKIPSEMYYLYKENEWVQISGGILEVDKLPTSGEDNYVYALKKQPTYDVYVNEKEQGISNLTELAKQSGGKVEVVAVVNILPTENIIVSPSDREMNLYYIKNDGLYMYADFTGDGNVTWHNFADAMVLSFSGEVTSESDMTVTDSLYLLSSGGDSANYYIYEKGEPTQVPNSGLIENLYFNTKLSIEEVDAILSQLTYDTDGHAYVVGAYEKGSSYGNIIIVEANAFTQGQIPSGYIIGHMHDTTDMTKTEFIYMSNQGLVDLALTLGINTKVGWNMETLNLNQTFIGHYGTENDKLINVISTTPYPRWTKISGGGATVKATPIAVPNSGYVERVYFNTKLTDAEIVATLDKLAELEGMTTVIWPTLLVSEDENSTTSISAMKSKFGDIDEEFWIIMLMSNTGGIKYIWSEHSWNAEEIIITSGWNTGVNYIDINHEVVPETKSDFDNGDVGKFNSEITNLFSLNGVFQEEEIELTESYDGNPLVLSNKYVKKTVVPNEGYVERVYFNTSLSVEEVKAILEKFYTYDDVDTLDNAIWLINIDDFNSSGVTPEKLYWIMPSSDTGDYAIVNALAQVIFKSDSSKWTGGNFVGWNPEFITAEKPYLEINSQVFPIVTENGKEIKVGGFNDKLVDLFSLTPFEEKIYDSVEVDIKEMLEEKKLPLEIKVNVESESVNVVKQGGTQVPSSGTVEKVYINTSLSVEEVDNILDSLELISLEIVGNDGFGYFPFIIDIDNYLLIYKNLVTGNYFINHCKNGNVILLFTDAQDQDYTAGWQVNYNFIEFNTNNLVSQYASELGQTMQNDKLINLISATPFESKVIKTLKGDYQAVDIVLSEVPNDWQSKPVPNTGYVEKIYFNTSLSVYEVVSLLSQLTYNNQGMNPLALPSDGSIALTAINIEGAYMLIDYLTMQSQTPTIYFVSVDIGFGFTGWNPDFNGVIEINQEVIPTDVEGDDPKVGLENDKLTNLISIAPPLEKTINLTRYLDNKQMPMSVKVNNGSINIVSQDGEIIKTLKGDYEAINLTFNEPPNFWQETVFVNGNYVEKLYFNTELTTDEIDAIFSTLTYDDNSHLITQYATAEAGRFGSIYIIKMETNGLNGYTIRISNFDGDSYIYASNQETVEYIRKNFNKTIKVGLNVTELPINNTIHSVSNEISNLTNLISSKPLLKNTINVESYLDNKQMPMSVTVNVESQEPNLQEKEITENGEYVADEGYDGFSKVTVNVAGEDMLQARVDATNSCEYLFYQYKGDNVDFIKDLDTSNVTNMSSMFNGCSMLKTIPQLDTSNVTDMISMFRDCSALETIPQLDMIKSTNRSQMFYNCSKLTNLTLLNIKAYIDLSQNEKLTLESLINTVKEFINVGSARILTMGTANLSKIASTYVKFTDSSVTSIPKNEKGDVVVCESTDEGAMLLKDYALLKNWTLA